MDWIDFAQDRDGCRAHVIAVMSLWVSHDAGECIDWLRELLAPGEGLCSMELGTIKDFRRLGHCVDG